MSISQLVFSYFTFSRVLSSPHSSTLSRRDTQTLSLSRILFLFVHLFLSTLISIQIVEAGICWSVDATSSKDGRCTNLLQTQVTKEDCCNGGDAATYGIATAYSPEDLKSGQLFFLRSLRGGVPCSPCKVTCEGVQCESDRRCVVKQGYKPTCICSPKCSRRKRRLGPVCGSDGHTYRHRCRLAKRKCRKDATLSVAYYGPCKNVCDQVKCTHNKQCIHDQDLKPHCVRCKTHCPPVNPGVGLMCGVNNVTYNSLCHLKRAACLIGKSIPLAYRGECRSNNSSGNEV